MRIVWPGVLQVFDPQTGDYVAGGRKAVQHLAAVGRRRIALVRGPVHLSQSAGRLEGARAACAELGLSSEELVASTFFVRGGMNAGVNMAHPGRPHVEEASCPALSPTGAGVPGARIFSIRRPRCGSSTGPRRPERSLAGKPQGLMVWQTKAR